MADEPLFLLRVPLRTERLMQLGARRGMRAADLDPGYAVHLALSEMFDAEAPRVFSIQKEARGTVEVLGYTRLDAGALAERATTFADPLAASVCDWDGLVSKPMPVDWPQGKRLGFEIRACPVRRGQSENHGRWERDAFLVACDHADDDHDLDGRGTVEREPVYLAWFDDLLGRVDGLKIERRKLTAYRRVRLWRRTQGRSRRGSRIERPDALFHGVLEVTDGAAFAAALRRGVGRHRRFGFGMILLKPPTDRAC